MVLIFFPPSFFQYSQIRQGSYYFILDGIFRCSQNFMAIIMLTQLSALSYSVASVVKRLFVILTAIVFFATPASSLTYFGLSLALAGLLWYNLVSWSNVRLPLYFQLGRSCLNTLWWSGL